MKTRFFAVLFLFMCASFSYTEEQTQTLLEKVNLSGNGVVLFRACTSTSKGCSSTIIPYHAGYYVNFNFNIKVNENVYLEDILTAENQSLSAGYSRQNVLKNRFSAFYQAKSLKLRAGNLGRIKSGNGLTIDELYSDGMKLTLNFKKFNIDYISSAAGLVLYEDLGILQFTNAKRTVGLYANFHRGQDFPVRNSVYSGIFINFPLYKDLKLYSEYSSYGGRRLNLFSTPSAYLLGLSFKRGMPKFNVSARFEHRFYDEEFNKPLQNKSQDTFFALEEEDKKFNNWWNYLYILGDIRAFALALNAEYAVSPDVQLFTDYEYIDLTSVDKFLGYKAKGKVNLYKTGFNYYLDKDRKAFLSYSVSNKFLNSSNKGLMYRFMDANYSSFEFHFKL